MCTQARYREHRESSLTAYASTNPPTTRITIRNVYAHQARARTTAPRPPILTSWCWCVYCLWLSTQQMKQTNKQNKPRKNLQECAVCSNCVAAAVAVVALAQGVLCVAWLVYVGRLHACGPRQDVTPYKTWVVVKHEFSGKIHDKCVGRTTRRPRRLAATGFQPDNNWRDACCFVLARMRLLYVQYMYLYTYI